jgi:hypothetical protein
MGRQAAAYVATLPLFALLFCAGCQKKEEAPVSFAAPVSEPAPLYKQPALTDEKITRFLASVADDKKPLGLAFRPGSQAPGTAEMKFREAEFDAYAQKHGFQHFGEYADTWNRLSQGQLQVDGAASRSEAIERNRKAILEAEAELIRPDVTDEERQMYTRRMQTAETNLVNQSKADEYGLNEPDLALVKKYSARIEAAMRMNPGK